MTKPVGGRGHKAPYQTIIIRIPVDVKMQVDKIVDNFRGGELKSGIDSERDELISQIQKELKAARKASKETRDWTKHDQLINRLEGLIIKLATTE